MLKRESYIIFLLLVLPAGCQNKRNSPESEESPVAVIVSNPEKISVSDTVSLSGNIEGNRTVRLGFMVSGRIDFIAVNEGQHVNKGQLIASLDPGSYAIAKELADIQVKQTEDEYSRLKYMYDNKSLSESDFSKISSGLQQARAQQRLHSRNLEETKLFSPLSGILLKKMAEVGEITGTGIPVFAVSDIQRIKVTAFVPENDLHKVRIGQEAGVVIPALNRTFSGSITEVGSLADPASRSFPVKISVENPGLIIRPGMIAEVKITPTPGKDALFIPIGSLLHDLDDQSYVFTVDESAGKAYMRNVGTGKLRDGKIEIKNGLSDTDKVVTGGHHRLIDGSSVTISR